MSDIEAPKPRGEPPSRLIKKELRRLMAEGADVMPDGTMITNAQKVAQILLKTAMGWTEDVRDPDTNLVRRVRHDPEPWALKEVMDRYEGKPAAMTEETVEGVTASQKVSDLLVDRINKLVTRTEEENAG